MPITKQVIKRVKQAKVRTARNRHYKSDMKSMVKLMTEYIQKNELDKAMKILPKVAKAIDTASKKNIIHQNNAARKKSFLQRALNEAQKGGAKKAPKAAKATKKEEVKKEEKEEAKA